MENLVLIGMPGCGKSTVGVVLAKTLGKRFVDTDLLIQEMQGQLLQPLLDTKGMEFFLKAEENALLSVDECNAVIATGGSAVYSEAGMAHLKRNGRVVYLKLPLECIEQRLFDIKTRGIALGPGESIASLYEKRIPLYETYSDLTIDGDRKTVEEVVSDLISLLCL